MCYSERKDSKSIKASSVQGGQLACLLIRDQLTLNWQLKLSACELKTLALGITKIFQ